MEALSLLLDCIVVLLLVYMGMRDESRKAGLPETSLFRTIDKDPVGKSPSIHWQPEKPPARTHAR